MSRRKTSQGQGFSQAHDSHEQSRYELFSHSHVVSQTMETLKLNSVSFSFGSHLPHSSFGSRSALEPFVSTIGKNGLTRIGPCDMETQNIGDGRWSLKSSLAQAISREIETNPALQSQIPIVFST
ncbi:hypothetical protein TorRG33x02_062130 [Trema orientale]|uniref:Uncharacterized protein n=1 Tax=Trema orientale TaxID=63057 RepID=A0A2P5FJC0_TREOI|nr:hypothetical protein TorRG33x02_062130 [Trema orientale]